MTIKRDCCPTDISEQDILAAMKRIPGYIDITPADFKTIYEAAYQGALERLTASLHAGDIMQRQVVTLSPATPLVDAAALLSQHKISGAPVVDKRGRVVGVISEKDFLSLMGVARAGSFMAVVAKCFLAKGCPAISGRKKTVTDLMSTPAVTVGQSATLQEISLLMAQKKINRIPVTDADDRIAGIVTHSVMVSAYCKL